MDTKPSTLYFCTLLPLVMPLSMQLKLITHLALSTS